MKSLRVSSAHEADLVQYTHIYLKMEYFIQLNPHRFFPIFVNLSTNLPSKIRLFRYSTQPAFSIPIAPTPSTVKLLKAYSFRNEFLEGARALMSIRRCLGSTWNEWGQMWKKAKMSFTDLMNVSGRRQ